jgi:phosphoglycerate dehydrogenase-like enzyme
MSTVLAILAKENWDYVFGREERARVEKIAGTPLEFYTLDSILAKPEPLSTVETLFTGWGMGPCDADFLRLAPRLKLVIHAAGSVRGIAREAMWDRGVRITTANDALAISVAEFVVAQVIFALKGVVGNAHTVRSKRVFTRVPAPGVYGSTVGLISLGTVARHLISLLRPFGLSIVAYDPFCTPEQARSLGVRLCSLDEVFEVSDVVSLHTPWLPETERMIRASHFEKMKPWTTFINTARGAVVDEKDLVDVFTKRSDLFAFIDVTYPEPPVPDSPLYTMPNVLLTPHIAGCLDADCRRLGKMAADEYERYLRGEHLLGEVTRERARFIA